MHDLAAHSQTMLEWALGDDPLVRAVAAGQDRLPETVAASCDAVADAADADDPELRSAGLAACFGGIVEACNDRLDVCGRTAYAALFPRMVWRVAARRSELAAALAEWGIADETALRRGYHQRRSAPAPVPDRVGRVVVPSRVTLGADVLITSVVCQQIRQRWPAAEVVVLGDPKLQGLLGGLPGVRVQALRYGRRGPLGERIATWLTVRDAVAALEPDLVVNPDSRLDQLGVLPLVSDDQRICLWENLQPSDGPPRSLADLVAEWCARRFGLEAAICPPRIAFDAPTALWAEHWRTLLVDRPTIACKFDHGGNDAKALPRAAEVAILHGAQARGWRILLDRGFGADELAASDALCAAAGLEPVDIDEAGSIGLAPDACDSGRLDVAALRFHGSIAGWAAALSACGAALSYDSVGHHLAAAAGISLVSVFTGHRHPAFPVAWAPRGAGVVSQVVIPTEERDDPLWWEQVVRALPLPDLG